MILGAVNTQLEAIVPLTVNGAQEREIIVDAVADTGYTGFLTLRPELIEALGLRFRRVTRATLADGSESNLETYEATLSWEGRRRRIFVHAAAIQPLIGMRLLANYEITIPVRPGGIVSITAMEP